MRKKDTNDRRNMDMEVKGKLEQMLTPVRWVMLCLLVLPWCEQVGADMYLHSPRGSNNRLDEEGRARNNANRLFDSQNNNRGGYNVGSVYYYGGSKVQVQWTNQHSCSAENSHCEIILQYMCGPLVRDGATTTTIPDNLMDCEDYNCDTDRRYGMHENHEYYMNCRLRERNKGLYTADQNLNGKNTAKNTRQNPNGNRRGYECPEERDYYPYWHPTPWKDIAVFTNKASRCPYYEDQSENVRGRGQCVLPREFLYRMGGDGHDHNLILPNTKEECEVFRHPANDPKGVQAEWKEFPSHGLPPPDCQESLFSRDNHLGNTLGGYPMTYNWTAPDIEEEHCTLRIRYNISTQDYEHWGSANASQNDPKRNNKNAEKGTGVDLSELVGLDNQKAAEARGYKMENNPQIQVFPGINMKLRLAINTAQFGRTFQDRSHTFAVRRRPADLEGAVIHNVNVIGKRGNIVQVYPAVEYDFVPNSLEASVGHFVHFQWTGSNTNPNNNDGQGRQGTDRSNLVQMGAQVYPEGPVRAAPPHGHWGRSYPAALTNSSLLGLGQEDLRRLAFLRPHQFGGEMSELDDAGTYFDLGPRKVTRAGVQHYMSTRNNNFSNRSQKGRITALLALLEQRAIGWNGGNMSLSDGTELKVKRGTFSELKHMRMEQWAEPEARTALAQQHKLPPGDKFASGLLVISPERPLTTEGRQFSVEVPYTASSLHSAVLYQSLSEGQTWTRVDTTSSGSKLAFSTDSGGVFLAVNEQQGGTVAGIVIGLVVALALAVLGVVCLVRKPPANLRRHFAGKV